MKNKTQTQIDLHNRYMKNKKQRIEYALGWNKRNVSKTKMYQKKYMRSIAPRLNKYNAGINKEKRKSYPLFNIKCQIMSRHTQFIRGYNDSYETYVNMNLEQYKAYIEHLWTPNMTWENYGTKWQIRRKVGYKNIDLSTEEGIKEFCSVDNIKLFSINTD